MSDEQAKPDGPDLAAGVVLSQLPDGGTLAGHAHGERAILVRRGDRVFAIGATCTHYGGPLGEGLVVGDTVRCPWHHACFDLRSGEALRAPALDPVPCWRVEQRDGRAYVRERLVAERPPPRGASTAAPVVIVGAGAAGNAAAETLRREGYDGPITMVGDDESPPCDRPNLSKGYLAGTAPYEWVPLRSPAFYEEHRIDLRLRTRVVALDTAKREVRLADGGVLPYGALLLATGARPVRLQLPGADLPHVRYLRTLADCNGIIGEAQASRRAAIVGAGFIGLEVAASLRARDVGVDVVAPAAAPMERALGAQVGNFLRRVHEAHGVRFHLGTTPSAIEPGRVTLASGASVAADFVVVGIGVQPATELAEQAGLAIDRGVAVDDRLETSARGVFAAGDIARWPDPYTGDRIRVEHWVVAERQGRTAARNMLGERERFAAVPFFWTEQYDFALAYVGYPGRWDRVEIDGDLDARDCAVTYWRDGRKLAAAFVGRDRQALLQEVAFEQTAAVEPRS